VHVSGDLPGSSAMVALVRWRNALSLSLSGFGKWIVDWIFDVVLGNLKLQ